MDPTCHICHVAARDATQPRRVGRLDRDAART
jgi:hypothetical protein